MDSFIQITVFVQPTLELVPLFTGMRERSFSLYSYSWLNKSDSRFAFVQFCNTGMITDQIGLHALSPITIIYEIP